VQPVESAVVVPIPEAEPVVGALRAQLDRAATWGVPAHVTVLYPFLPPDLIGPDELRRLEQATSLVPRFAVTFTRVSWFGDDVLWLAPEPAAGFRGLTAAVVAAFPGHLPYGGVHGDEPVPHLTVGARAPVDRLRAAATAVAARLPIDAAVGVCHLLQGRDEPGTWHQVAELPLG
jgi:2'-5' RNA ligase superfamily